MRRPTLFLAMASGNLMLRDVRALAEALKDVRIDDETVALAGQLTGAVFGMQCAVEFEHRSRQVAGARRALSYRAELRRSQLALSRSERPGRAWLAGFYFNSALARIAAAADRMTKKLKGGRTLRERAENRQALFARTPEVETVYQAVNDLKHDFEGRSAKDDVTIAVAMDALRAVIEVACDKWPRR